MKDGLPFALAGISEIWSHPSGIDILNFAVLTFAPNEMMATIHDRMPVILHRNDYARWLSTEPDPADLMKPFPAALMSQWPVARRLNNDKRGGPETIAAIEVVYNEKDHQDVSSANLPFRSRYRNCGRCGDRMVFATSLRHSELSRAIRPRCGCRCAPEFTES
jgi:hypothetical protein